MRLFGTVLACLILASCALSQRENSSPTVGSHTSISSKAGVTMDYWQSDPEAQTFLLETLDKPSDASDPDDVDTLFEFQTDLRYQTMDGFGASLTESSAYVISKLPKEEQDRLMLELFGSADGLGISFLRQTMGSCDFSLGIYSYNDLAAGEEDPDQTKFSIDIDRTYILPLLKQALSLNPGLVLMASPWSPPAWMKTGKTMLGSKGGTLRPDLYDSYARYFVKFLQEYQKEGVHFDYVSPQNEPQYGPPAYPGMVWSASEESVFVRDALGPAFRSAGITTGILIWDHNWDNTKYARQILEDPQTSSFILGSAWHYYNGQASAMSEIKEAFPDKDIWFTEDGSGRWIGGDTLSGQFKDGIQKAIQICQNWSKSVVWWNIALDTNNGPIVFPNTANYGLVEIDTVDAKITKKHAAWYTLEHFSRFVKHGAVRIGFVASNKDLLGVAFLNTDGSKVAIIANPYTSSQTAVIRSGNQVWSIPVPGDGAVTCKLE